MKQKGSFLLFILLAVFALTVPAFAAPSITLNKTSKVLYVGADKLGYRRVSLVPVLKGLSGKVRYSSSDPSVVKVNSAGRAYALKKGKATITASVKYNGKTYKAKCLVTVKKPSIKFGVKNPVVNVGETISIPVTITPKSSVRWSVYNSSKAYVDNGNVTGLKSGATYIYAEANGIKKKLRITIQKNPQENDAIPSHIYVGGKYQLTQPTKIGNSSCDRVMTLEILQIENNTVWVSFKDRILDVISDWVAIENHDTYKISYIPVTMSRNIGTAQYKDVNDALIGNAIITFYPDYVVIEMSTLNVNHYRNTRKVTLERVN